MPESELPWLVPVLPVYYQRSTGERVPDTIVGPCPKGGRRISIRYKLGVQEVLYKYAPEELMEALVDPPKPRVDAESPSPPN